MDQIWKEKNCFKYWIRAYYAKRGTLLSI